MDEHGELDTIHGITVLYARKSTGVLWREGGGITTWEGRC